VNTAPCTKAPAESKTFRMHFGQHPELSNFGDSLAAPPTVTVALDNEWSAGTVLVGATLVVGQVVDLTLTDPGGGYEVNDPPEVEIEPPTGVSGGDPATYIATATARVDPVTGQLAALTLTFGGQGYVVPPAVTIDGTATATARIQKIEIWAVLSGGADASDYAVTFECDTLGGAHLVEVGVLRVRAKP